MSFQKLADNFAMLLDRARKDGYAINLCLDEFKEYASRAGLFLYHCIVNNLISPPSKPTPWLQVTRNCHTLAKFELTKDDDPLDPVPLAWHLLMKHYSDQVFNFVISPKFEPKQEELSSELRSCLKNKLDGTAQINKPDLENRLWFHMGQDILTSLSHGHISLCKPGEIDAYIVAYARQPIFQSCSHPNTILSWHPARRLSDLAAVFYGTQSSFDKHPSMNPISFLYRHLFLEAITSWFGSVSTIDTDLLPKWLAKEDCSEWYFISDWFNEHKNNVRYLVAQLSESASNICLNIYDQVGFFEIDSINYDFPEKTFVINLFLKQKDGWKITYEGQTWTTTKEYVGLNYIYQLIMYPRKGINVNTLLTGKDTKTFSGSDDIADDDTLDDINSRLQELDNKIRSAGKDDDTSEFVKEKEDLLKHVRSCLGFGKRKRKLGGDDDKIRTQVGNSIKNAIKKIGEHLPDLAQHLNASIKNRLGISPSYEPEVPPFWSL